MVSRVDNLLGLGITALPETDPNVIHVDLLAVEASWDISPDNAMNVCNRILNLPEVKSNQIDFLKFKVRALICRGNVYKKRGNWEAAIQDFKAALSLLNEKRKYLINETIGVGAKWHKELVRQASVGLKEAEEGKISPSLTEAKRKVEEAKAILIKEVRLSEIERGINLCQEALRIYKRSDINRPNHYVALEAMVVEAKLLIKRNGVGDWDKALEFLNQIVDDNGNPVRKVYDYWDRKWDDKATDFHAATALVSKINLYLLSERLIDWQALEKVLRTILEKQKPEDYLTLEGWLALAKVQDKQDKFEEASASYRKAIELIPGINLLALSPEEQIHAKINLEITKATAYLEWGDIIGYKLKNYSEAVEKYKNALELLAQINLTQLPAGTDTSWLSHRIETLRTRANVNLGEIYLYGLGDFKTAEGYFRNVIGVLVIDKFQAMKAHNGLGDLLRIYKIKKADKSRVEELLDQVKQHYLKAIILGKEIEDRTDLSDKDKALIYPQLLKAHRGLQEVYFGLKEYKEAIEEYKEVEKLKGKLRTPRAEKLENNITLLEAHYLGGMTYLYGLKDYENALKAYEAGIKLSSEVVKDLEILPAGRQTEIKELILKLYFGKAETLIQLGSRTNDFQYYDQAIKMLEGILANATFKEMTDQIAIAVGKYTHWQKDWPGKKAALEKAKALLQPVGNKLKDKPEKLYTYLEATLYLGWADLGLGNRESALQLADEGLRLLDPRRKDPDYEELYKKFLELRGAASGVAGIRTAVGLGIESFEDNVGNGERKFKLQGTLLVGGGSLSFAYIDRSRAQDGRILGPWAKDIQLGFNWAGGKIQTTFIKYFLPDGQKVARNLASLEFNRDWQIAKYSYLRFNTFGNFEFNFMDDNPAASYEGQVSYKPTFGRLWSSLTYGYKTDSRARWAPTSPVNLNTHSLNIASGMSGNWGDLGLSFWYPLTYQLQQNSSEVTIENDSNGNRWVVYPSGYKEFFPRHLAPSISLGGTINFGSFSVNASVSKAFSKDYQSSYFNLEIGKNW